MNNNKLSRRSATLIVGGGSVIGGAIVKQFCTVGDVVTATYRSSFPNSLVSEVSWVPLDLASNDSIAQFGIWLSSHERWFDNVVFVAGILPGKSLEEYLATEMEAVINVNFLGQAKCVKVLLPHLNSGSKIIMMSSISGERGSYDPIYAASKGAIIAFVKSLATWLPPKTRCIAVAPGSVSGSAMFLSMSSETQKSHRDKTPIKELITAENLAKVIVDLTEGHWAHANGACVRINGGLYV